MNNVSMNKNNESGMIWILCEIRCYCERQLQPRKARSEEVRSFWTIWWQIKTGSPHVLNQSNFVCHVVLPEKFKPEAINPSIHGFRILKFTDTCSSLNTQTFQQSCNFWKNSFVSLGPVNFKTQLQNSGGSLEKYTLPCSGWLGSYASVCMCMMYVHPLAWEGSSSVLSVAEHSCSMVL